MKSPAYLFYSKDWLTDTAEFEPEEKGVYIDLLAYQHVNGSLPADIRKLAKLARLPEDEFLKIWANIKHKFDQMDNRMVNQKLNQIIEQNNDRAIKNRINGQFAVAIRLLDQPAKVISQIKNSFDYKLFVNKKEAELKESINQWVNQMVDNTAYVDAKANNVNTEVIKEVVGFLNQKTGSNYRTNGAKTIACIQARINESFTIDDFKKVIEIKSTEWLGTDLSGYLRPETLFGPKFESYLNQKNTKNGGQQKHQGVSTEPATESQLDGDRV